MSPAIRRRRRIGIAGVLGTVGVLALTLSSTLAFHVGTVAFELDGNTAPSGAPGVDWEELFNASGGDIAGNDILGGAGAELDRAFVKDFVVGASGPDTSYHAPSNKDAQQINPAGGSSVWGCVSANNPTDKDDILNAYAIAYTGEGEDAGDLIVAFGAERFDDSGTAYMGFWLFQADVTCNLATGKFTGQKTAGDILMLANFSNGGSNVTINAFEWEPGTPAATAAGTFVSIGTGVRCDLTTDNNGGSGGGSVVDMCAITNGPATAGGTGTNVTVPWATEDKDKPGPNDPVNTLEPPEFVEGSINLTDAFRAANVTPPACFGSFMAETRSSDTLSATLKDFALGDLNTCDARVSISPSETNRVGEAHTFTVTATKSSGGAFTAATVGNVDVTLTGANGIGTVTPTGGTCLSGQPSGDNLDAGGQCTITVNSTVTGTITASATAAIDLGGGSILTRTTNNANGNSAPAVKTYVDATIDITGDGTNRVGQSHQFTATVKVDNGNGSGFVNANGVAVTIAKTDASGATSNPSGSQTCTTGTSGTCSVSFASSTTGTTTGTASASVTVGGITFGITSADDAATTGNEAVLKTWVNAQIDIAANDVNRVGESHTFTVTVQKDAGGGGGFVPAAGVTVTPAETGVGAITGGTCTTGATDSLGQCTVTVNSTVAGSSTVTASATVSVGGINVAVSTDGTGLNSGGATKAWVDLRIGITGTDTNGIGEPHTFTIKVERNDGSGWANLSNAQPNVTLLDASGASHVLDTTATTCDVSGDSHNGAGTNASGECVVVFTSNAAGTVTGSASVSSTISGLSVSATTGDSTSLTGATVIKTFKAGSLIWHKVDNKGAPLAGATFEVCRTESLDSSTDPDGSVDDDPDVCFTILDNDATDEDAADGEFLVSDLVLGTYTVRETLAPAGYHIDNVDAVSAGSMTLEPAPGDQDLEIVDPFVNSKAYRLIVLTCDDITDLFVTSAVTLAGDTRDTITAADLASLGWLDANGDPLTEADLCGLPGANYGDLDEGTYSPSVKLPK